MAEHVRLVIWDLDDTFWSGTLTEGGITQYIRAHHNIVVELARRGIISSICSRNEYAETMACLRERGIAEYFVFPSISWEPKGARIARLIEAVQLRPASVMFIDNDPAIEPRLEPTFPRSSWHPKPSFRTCLPIPVFWDATIQT